MFDPYNARTSLVRYILPLFVLVVMVVMLQMMLDMRSRASALKAEACEESDFRQQHVTPGLYRSIWKAALVEGTGADGFANILTATMLNSGFYPRQVRADSVPYRKYKPEEYELIIAHFVIGISLRTIAKKRRCSDGTIRKELQTAIGFIEGVVSILV